MIRFSKFTWLYAFISGAIIIPGIISLVTFGLKPSIDFTGGALIEVAGKELTAEQLTLVTQDAAVELASIQRTDSGTFLIRVKAEDNETITNAIRTLSVGQATPAAIVRNELVGPVLGQELLQKTLIAAFLAVTGILLYVAYAFKNLTYGVAAIVALIHDVIVVLGIFSLLGRFAGVEVDTLFVTAILTTMGFSVHDTIVVFDRIREMQRKGVKGGFTDLADSALTQTMSRSLANSVTIMIMLVALVLLGGGTIQWFAVALLAGTMCGTYSSPFVATPVLILLKHWQQRKRTFPYKTN